MDLRETLGEKHHLCMLLFIASESGFFAFLLWAYIYLRGSVHGGPNSANSLDPKTTGLYSIALLSSSGTFWLCERALKRGSRRGFALWLGGSIVLGLVFIVGQTREYWGLLHKNVTISRNTFGTTFFTLTGFHGVHVCLGLVMLAVLLGATLGSGKPTDGHHTGVRVVGYYWHFVDAVWVVLYSVIYLWVLAQ